MVPDTDVDLYLDWGGPNQVIIDSATTDVDGIARFSPTILEDTTPDSMIYVFTLMMT